MSSRVYVAAVEDSGDALGADVVSALREQCPELVLAGIGGDRMRDLGLSSKIEISDLSVLGFLEGIRAYGLVKERVEAVALEIEAFDPQVVVLIDSWGFMWRLAKRLKTGGSRARIVKLVGPQVWATRPGRAKVLARWCDHLLCIHAFEEPFYVPYGLQTTVIGNPALGRLQPGDAAGFRSEYGIGDDEVLIGLLPGSRNSEIDRVAPTLMGAAELLCAADPTRRVVTIVAPTVADRLQALAKTWRFPNVVVSSEEVKGDAMAAMTVSLACSGTVTTELAARGSAVVVGYKLGWVTWALARLFLLRTKFITLLNVAAGREVIPEFVQTKLSARNIAEVAEQLLSSQDALRSQLDGQAAALVAMQADTKLPAAKIAAGSIVDQVRMAEAV